MKNRKTYTGAFKAQVVLDLIHGKKSLAELATQNELHPNQIKNWKSFFLKQAINIFDDKRKTGRSDRWSK